MRFSVLVVVGDKKGRVGLGIGKGPDVASAVRKAISFAKKRLITVPLKGTTIPCEVRVKYGAAKILMKPAPRGSGIIAGGPMRAAVEAAGIQDIVAKMLGSNNKISNIYATIEAFRKLAGLKERKEEYAASRAT